MKDDRLVQLATEDRRVCSPLLAVLLGPSAVALVLEASLSHYLLTTNYPFKVMLTQEVNQQVFLLGTWIAACLFVLVALVFWRSTSTLPFLPAVLGPLLPLTLGVLFVVRATQYDGNVGYDGMSCLQAACVYAVLFGGQAAAASLAGLTGGILIGGLCSKRQEQGENRVQRLSLRSKAVLFVITLFCAMAILLLTTLYAKNWSPAVRGRSVARQEVVPVGCTRA